jgi:hypothetical protein
MIRSALPYKAFDLITFVVIKDAMEPHNINVMDLIFEIYKSQTIFNSATISLR